jgi:two-component system sensor histidine kinase RegB
VTSFNDIKLHWIKRLRWLAIISQMLALFPAYQYGYIENNIVPIYLMIVAGLILINIAPQLTQGSVTINLVLDLVAFTGLITLTGNVENPFWPLLYVQVALAAMLLNPKRDWVYILALVMCTLTVQIRSNFEYYPWAFTILPQWIILSAIWFLTRIVGLELNFQRDNLENLKARESKFQKLKSLGALTSGILHELGTPMNTLRLKVDRLNNKGVSAFSNEDIEVLDLALKQCEKVTSDLNRAQYETDDSLGSVNLLELAREFDVTRDIKFPEVCAHKTNLMIILKIIVDNAIEAGATSIGLTTPEQNHLRISDNGEGFNEHILTNFGSPYNTTKGKGHGLGLYSALLNMESMGGSLFVSNHDNGAIIDLYFGEACK